MNYIFRHVTNEVITPAGNLLKKWDGVQWCKE